MPKKKVRKVKKKSVKKTLKAKKPAKKAATGTVSKASARTSAPAARRRGAASKAKTKTKKAGAVKTAAGKKGSPKKQNIQPLTEAQQQQRLLEQEAKEVGGILLGKVEDFFSHVQVVALTLQQPLALGDSIRIKGHTTDFTQRVESMQIEHQAVTLAKTGDSVGIRVGQAARHGDRVYKI